MNDPSASRFRILSLEGGGVRGAFSASFLSAVERISNKTVADYFDLIVGTSTGGLIALALGLGRTPNEVLRFYETESPRIFGGSFTRRAARRAKGWIAARHPAEILKNALVIFLGMDTRLASSRRRLVIPSYNATDGKPVCFKTPHSERLFVDKDRRVWEIGMATSAAPTYFPPYKASWGCTYVDGGVWANRPSIIGIVEAIQFLRVPLERISVLSVRTPGSRYRLRDTAVAGGIPWVVRHKIFDLLLDASGSAATFEAQHLLGDRFIEIETDTGQLPIELDDARQVDSLRGMGESAAQAQFHRIEKLLDSPAPQPPSWSPPNPQIASD